LDGARLFNAVAATGVDASEWARHFDSVSICFSKGLGAPVGSALAGPREFIAKARRARKLFGGGMRQAGIIAAAALHALEHHRQRLIEDHGHATLLADRIRQLEGLSLLADPVQTNIVIFRIDPSLGSAAAFAAKLEEKGLRSLAFSPHSIRMVTHLDVARPQIQAACEILAEVHRSCRSLVGAVEL
jgi:threonine aldolase